MYWTMKNLDRDQAALMFEPGEAERWAWLAGGEPIEFEEFLRALPRARMDELRRMVRAACN
ncbi:MAG: hypothetical protein NTW87_02455 [Planctomycetota bacterium]|nr:hypothetical protein [Planctomycetota bacterium]